MGWPNAEICWARSRRPNLGRDAISGASGTCIRGRFEVKRYAQDGLAARVSGPWTQEKLTYVEKYATAFMKAMAPHRKPGKWAELVYLDFLAGPGRGIDRDTGAEFDGSPLRAIKVVPAFDRLFFSDSDRRMIEALRQRIPA